jgi:High-temperature-induced dauer-formation protein
LDTGRSLDFLIVLLYYPLEHKSDSSQIGLVRMSAFILQTLSAEKGFGVSLNRPFEGQGALPSTVRLTNFHGSYADFMIIVFTLSKSC